MITTWTVKLRDYLDGDVDALEAVQGSATKEFDDESSALPPDFTAWSKLYVYYGSRDQHGFWQVYCVKRNPDR